MHRGGTFLLMSKALEFHLYLLPLQAVTGAAIFSALSFGIDQSPTVKVATKTKLTSLHLTLFEDIRLVYLHCLLCSLMPSSNVLKYFDHLF